MGVSLCLMKLRVDLLDRLTDQDILREALANHPRYKPQPSFSKTGVGSLSSASTAQRASEVRRSTDLIQKLKQRSPVTGPEKPARSLPSTKR